MGNSAGEPDDVDDVLGFQSLRISQATYGAEDDTEYRRLRKHLLDFDGVVDLVPQYSLNDPTIVVLDRFPTVFCRPPR